MLVHMLKPYGDRDVAEVQTESLLFAHFRSHVLSCSLLFGSSHGVFLL